MGAICTIVLGMYACRKSQDQTTQVEEQQQISATVTAQIKNLGFNTDNIKQVDGGYVVEGDIFLNADNLAEASTKTALEIAETEQYRTTNLVKNLPRTITISVTNLPQVYSNAVDEMIDRYNALNLRLKFAKASAGTTGTINVVGFNEGPSGGYITLGSAGFPTSSGQPHNQIRMNTNQYAYGANPDLMYLASVLQHEVGHCIGFRHTDYKNRSYSCGGAYYNEGRSSIGAVRIPGTPSGADADSYMLACANGGNRTFNSNDVVALNYLYK